MDIHGGAAREPSMKTSNALTGTTARENNKIRPEDRAAHDWYRFVLSFPPHLVREYIELFGLRSANPVLDPFCSTGTTLVECKKLGVQSVGIEANPIACFASQVKTDWSVDPDSLLVHASKVAEITTQKLRADGIGDMDDLPLFRTDGKVPSPLRTLPPDKLPWEETTRLSSNRSWTSTEAPV